MRFIAVSLVALAFMISAPSNKVLGVEIGLGIDTGGGIRVGGEIDVGTFETQLAPDGRWIEVDGTRSWQPAVEVSDSNWQPYLNDGHWVWTDDGWYWESNYKWGWAAFHYGRWDRVANYNWVWTPDVVWAPAWVSWRESDSVYGWAPYGRRDRFEGGIFVGGGDDIRADYYHFVPSQSFLSINLSTVAYSRDRSEEHFKQTRDIKGGYSSDNNRVINHGIPVKSVAAATRQEIKPAHIADVTEPSAKGEHAGSISAYRPAVKASGRASEPKANTAVNGRNNEPRAVEPKAKIPEPRAEEPRAHIVEPKAPNQRPVAPKATEPAAPEHRAVTPRPEEFRPRPVEPRAVEPRAVEPRAPEHKAVEPRAEPRAAEPRAVEPRAAPERRAPEPKAEEPKGRGTEK